jgi:hypothetical protein
MDRVRVASAVAGSLFETEAAVEDALAKAVGLMRQMMDARRALGLPVVTGDPALLRVTAAVDALGEAQREIVRTHGELEALSKSLGLDPLGFGPLVKPAEGRTERLSTD